jgi:adenylate cyclase
LVRGRRGSGDFIEAQANLVEALSIDDPERNREARFRFGPDTGVAVRAYLAMTKWLLGEVGPARTLIEMVRGDAGAAQRDAEIVAKLRQENALTIYAGALQCAWASARFDGHETGVMELRQALAAYTDQGNKVRVPFSQGLLAEIEAQGDPEGALTRIDEALALAGETGEHWSDAFLHRCRGEILLKRDPAK